MTVQLAVAILIAVIGSNLAVEIFKAAREDKKEKKAERKKQYITKEDLTPIKEGMRELLGEALDVKLKAWQHSEVRTAEEWDEIEELYKPYRKLDGNGTREKRYKECKNIPITE